MSLTYGMIEKVALYGGAARKETVPKDSANVFVAQGYGAALVRRLLFQLGWREAAGDEPHGPMLFWVGSGLARSRLRPVQKSWQLMNGFPRGGTMGQKSSMLQNLRIHCMKPGVPALASFYPRAYDLSAPRGLYAFLIDFAVSRAEALLRKIYSRQVTVAHSEEMLAAIKLLDRLVPVLEQEWKHLTTKVNMKWPPEDAMINFSAAEMTVVMPNRCAVPPVQHGDVHAPDSPAMKLLAALKMETRWWLNHLDQAAYRQRRLNGEQAFWILKEPHLNCGRGISVHSDLASLLETAGRGGWDFVVQKYLERPLLISDSRRKCDVRLWILVTSWNPAVVWAWSEPYFRLANKPFSWAEDQVANPFVHLTNRTVQKTQAGGESKDTESSVEPKLVDEDHIWMLSAFFTWASENGLQGPNGSTARDTWNNYTWPRMLEVVRTCVLSCQADVGHHELGNFELFGFDFLLDEDLEPWLLEANSSPDLCEDAGPSLRALAESALTEMFTLVPALQKGALQLPASEDPACDLSVSGAGRWHLCLREAVHHSAKELELQRILRASHPSKRLSGVRPAGLAMHAELLSNMFGQAHAPPSPRTTALVSAQPHRASKMWPASRSSFRAGRGQKVDRLGSPRR